MGMTIAIKDYEMPPSCYNCNFCIRRRTSDYGYFGMCDLTNEEGINLYEHSRSEDCPLVEAIPKAEYETRLMADMVAMLEVIKLRIDNLPEPLNRDRVNYCIQQKINELMADQEGEEEQQPTTKNDLGVDAISREDAIKAMQDKAKKLTNEDTINGLCGAVAILYEMPSVTPTSKECVDCVSRQAVLEITAETGALETQRRVKALPPVTPIRPKGHWIDIDETHSKCSGCGAVFGIYSANGEVNYCPNCGADMREVEE